MGQIRVYQFYQFVQQSKKKARYAQTSGKINNFAIECNRARIKARYAQTNGEVYQSVPVEIMKKGYFFLDICVRASFVSHNFVEPCKMIFFLLLLLKLKGMVWYKLVMMTTNFFIHCLKAMGKRRGRREIDPKLKYIGESNPLSNSIVHCTRKRSYFNLNNYVVNYAKQR